MISLLIAGLCVFVYVGCKLFTHEPLDPVTDAQRAARECSDPNCCAHRMPGAVK